MKPLMVSLRASTESEDIVDYYEDKRPGLGAEFTSHLKKAFVAIRQRRMRSCNPFHDIFSK